MFIKTFQDVEPPAHFRQLRLRVLLATLTLFVSGCGGGEPLIQNETAINTSPEVEIVAESETETSTQVVTDTDNEPVAETVPEGETVLVTEVELDTDTEAETDIEAEIEAEVETESEVEAETNAEAETDAEGEIDTDAETVPETSPVPPDVEPVSRANLNGVEINTWMYQIQDLDSYAAVDALAGTDYDMLVVEPGNTFKPDPEDPDFFYDTDYIVAQLSLKSSGDQRILLAYIDIGEAEEYRTYWQDDWVAPDARSSERESYPDFLVTVDPDGWSGNYPVEFWQQDWQDLWLGSDGIIADLASRGFHGVYLDWVESYDDDYVAARADQDGVDPALEMMNFIEEIGRVGRSIDPEFLVVAQNAQYLLDADASRYVTLIDAISTEDTWFYGEGDVDWEDLRAGDLVGGDRHANDYSTYNRIEQNKRYLELGIPVFTVDYCLAQDNAEQVYRDARSLGFIPLVTRVSLSEITQTPAY